MCQKFCYEGNNSQVCAKSVGFVLEKRKWCAVSRVTSIVDSSISRVLALTFCGDGCCIAQLLLRQDVIHSWLHVIVITHTPVRIYMCAQAHTAKDNGHAHVRKLYHGIAVKAKFACVPTADDSCNRSIALRFTGHSIFGRCTRASASFALCRVARSSTLSSSLSSSSSVNRYSLLMMCLR